MIGDEETTWIAETVTGSRYVWWGKDRHLRIFNQQGTMVLYMHNVYEMASAKPSEKLELPWEAPEKWRKVTEPVIGEHLYVNSYGSWRISTPVERVTRQGVTDG